MNIKNQKLQSIHWKKLLLIVIFMPQYFQNQELIEFFSASYFSTPKSGIKNNDGKIGLNTLDISIITPTFNIGERTKLNNMASYKSLDFNPGSKAISSIFPGQLNEIQYSLLFRRQLTEQWNLFILPQLIVRSDFKTDFGSRDFFPALAILAFNRSRKRTRLQWGYGVSYSRDFTKNTLTPLFAVNYTSSKFRMDIMLPLKAQFVMTPSKFWEYGVDINVENGIYNIGKRNVLNAQYARTINVPIGFTAATKISGMFWLKAKVGMQFFREYDFLDSNFKVLQNQERINSAPYASIGISLRIKE